MKTTQSFSRKDAKALSPARPKNFLACFAPLRELAVVALSFLCSFSVFAQTETNTPSRPSPYYYAIEDINTGNVVRRGAATEAGVARNEVILGPNTEYRAWLLRVADGLIGFTEFKTPNSGSRFDIPAIDLELPQTDDFDNDGLSDEAEFIVNSNPTNQFTFVEGITDGEVIKQGLSAFASTLTGIIGTVLTTNAVDVCAANDIAIVADSEGGVAAFNIFNRMQPLVIARVDTPGSAQRVACAGNYVAVADGAAGLAIIDMTDPPAATITNQVNLGSAAQAVAADGALAYVGLASNQVVSVDMATGVVLDRVGVNGPVLDLAIAGGVLYGITPTTLYAFALTNTILRVDGSVGTQDAGRRLFVGGTIAYVTHSRGYNTFDLNNPIQPTLIRRGSATEQNWKQIVANGQGPNATGVAAVGAFQNDATVDISVYDVSVPTNNIMFIQTIGTPGIANAVSIYNGLAYVADGASGLQVMNYLTNDFGGVSPTISVSGSFPITNLTGTVEEGKSARVTAAVDDDVQVRNVEFYIDDVKAATDGNFPFEFGFTTPRKTITKNSFLLKARASDTGGNFTFTSNIVVQLTTDATPPRVLKVTPRSGEIAGRISSLSVVFNEPIDPLTLTAASFQLFAVGPDGIVGSADDALTTTGAISYRDNINTALMTFSSPLGAGFYRVLVKTTVADLDGNPLTQPFTSAFWTFSPADSDGDGIPDEFETALGLNPNNQDSDGDTINDGDEDSDFDGLSNAREITNGTNPFVADTDGDGQIDGLEVELGSDPLDANSTALPTGLTAARAILVTQPNGLVAPLNAAAIAQPNGLVAPVNATAIAQPNGLVASPPVKVETQ